MGSTLIVLPVLLLLVMAFRAFPGPGPKPARRRVGVSDDVIGDNSRLR